MSEKCELCGGEVYIKAETVGNETIPLCKGCYEYGYINAYWVNKRRKEMNEKMLKQKQREKTNKEMLRGKTKEYIRGQGSVISTLIYQPIAAFLVAHVFMKTKITPNQITMLSIVFGVLSVSAFFFGGCTWFLMGAILLQISCFFDCADGQVARLKNMQSDFGATLDVISDFAVELPLYFAITFALYREFGAVWIWAIGFAAIYGIFMSHYLLQYLDRFDNHSSPRELIKNKFGVDGKRIYFSGVTNIFLIFLGAVFYPVTSHSVFNSMCLTLMFLAVVYNFHWVSQFLISLDALRKPKK